jgi:hypothetical protein
MEDDTLKRILQDKQFHLNIKAEQKEIIQNVLQRKDTVAVLPTTSNFINAVKRQRNLGLHKLDTDM